MIRILQEVDQVRIVFVFHLNWFELIYRCSKIEFILFRFIATATKIYFVNKSFRLIKLSDNEMLIQIKTVGLAVIFEGIFAPKRAVLGQFSPNKANVWFQTHIIMPRVALSRPAR